MIRSYALAALFAFFFAWPSSATELASIKRTILKEPTYHGKPRYCLLVFGKKADTLIWMVRDDKYHYFDLNANGDLTDPSEKIFSNGSASCTVAKLSERSGVIHQNLTVFSGQDGTFTINFGQGGSRTQYVGVGLMERPTWGDKSENAPIIHFGGPMSFDRYGPLVSIPRSGGYGRRLSLRVMLGTPGVGKGTFASYDEVCTEELGPIQADIVFSHKDRLGEMFERRFELLHDG